MTRFREKFVKYKKPIIITFLSTIIYYGVEITSYLVIREVPFFLDSRFLLYYAPIIVAFLSVVIFIALVYGTSMLMYKPNLRSLFAAAGFIVVCLILLRSTITHLYNPFAYDSVYFDKKQYVVGILLIGIFGPILEEIVFRGYVFQATENNFGALVAWIVNLSLFTIMHLFSNIYLDSIMLVLWYGGLVIITLAYQIGKLPASIAVHSFLNIYIFLSNTQ